VSSPPDFWCELLSGTWIGRSDQSGDMGDSRALRAELVRTLGPCSLASRSEAVRGARAAWPGTARDRCSLQTMTGPGRDIYRALVPLIGDKPQGVSPFIRHPLQQHNARKHVKGRAVWTEASPDSSSGEVAVLAL
jgi:hypothetical protein